MKTVSKKVCAGALMMGLGMAQQGVCAAETTFSASGYVKADALINDFSDGEVAAGNVVARDFYFPAKIPVSTGSGKGVTTLDMHAKQSRLILGSKTTYDDGQVLKTHVEMDFMVPMKGNENFVNAYEPGLRHAFATYGDYLVGQTWSNFMDVKALPDVLDFIGPTESSVFVRQPQVRMTKGAWSFSLENPETTLTKASDLISSSTGDALLPDVTAKYTHKLSQEGHIAVALLGRQLITDTTNTKETATGLGLSVSGKIVAENKDNVRFAVNAGQGIGRYIGLNLVNDAAIDGSGALKSIDTLSAFIACQHYWQPKWRSTLMLSHFSADYPDAIATKAAVVDTSSSASLNLIYALRPNVDVGAELMHAKLEKNDDSSGSLNRLQFSAKYSF